MCSSDLICSEWYGDCIVEFLTSHANQGTSTPATDLQAVVAEFDGDEVGGGIPDDGNLTRSTDGDTDDAGGCGHDGGLYL